jgi:hypothetical protein
LLKPKLTKTVEHLVSLDQQASVGR